MVIGGIAKKRWSSSFKRVVLQFQRVAASRVSNRTFEESKGLPVGTVWDDIYPLNSQAKESLGYPTQKPLPLLERVIKLAAMKTTLCWMLFADAERRW
jgi:hypothetical protein